MTHLEYHTSELPMKMTVSRAWYQIKVWQACQTNLKIDRSFWDVTHVLTDGERTGWLNVYHRPKGESIFPSFQTLHGHRPDFSVMKYSTMSQLKRRPPEDTLKDAVSGKTYSLIYLLGILIC